MPIPSWQVTAPFPSTIWITAKYKQQLNRALHWNKTSNCNRSPRRIQTTLESDESFSNGYKAPLKIHFISLSVHRIFRYADPHMVQLKGISSIDHQDTAVKKLRKLKFHYLLFTQLERKILSSMVTCINCSKIMLSFSPWKTGYSHCQGWSGSYS